MKPKGYWHIFENCREVASKCSSKSEFHVKYRAAYRASKQEGWFDKLVKMFWSYEDWTFEKCQSEASKYKDMQEFYVYSRVAYNAAEHHQWLDEVCEHMPSSERYWTYERLKEEIKKYNSKTEFVNKNEVAYRSALHNGWLDELCKDMNVLRRKKFTKEECILAAKPYNFIIDFITADPSMYNAARKNNWLEEVCSHMYHRVKKWTYDMLVAEAKKYKHKIEFLRNAPGAYTAAYNNGWLEEICQHMDDLGDMYNRAIYAWEFPDHHVYVGLTCDLNRREEQHLTDKNSPVYKHAKKTNLTPVFVLKYDYVFVTEAKRLEGEVLNYYIDNGWKKLNTVKTGGIGAVRELWNAESIERIAMTCKSRGEFMDTYPNVYRACSKKKLMYVLDKVFPKNIRVDKSGKVFYPHFRKWTDEKIWNEITKYESCTELMKNCRSAYRAAEKWGLLDKVKEYYTSLKDKNN